MRRTLKQIEKEYQEANQKVLGLMSNGASKEVIEEQYHKSQEIYKEWLIAQKKITEAIGK